MHFIHTCTSVNTKGVARIILRVCGTYEDHEEWGVGRGVPLHTGEAFCSFLEKMLFNEYDAI